MYIVLEVRRNESAGLIPSPLEACITRETRGQSRPTRLTELHPRGSVAVALSAFLRETFLFVEYFGFELFSSLFQIGVAFVVWKEGVPFDLLQWDFVFSIKVLGGGMRIARKGGGLWRILTISPSKTTFSPRMRKRPTHCSANRSWWYILSTVSSKTKLAESG